MAIEKVIDIKVQGNVDQAVGSLRSQLRQAQAEVAELSNKFGATSEEAVKAAQKAAELKDQIGDAKALTDAFNPDAKFKALTSSLGGVAGGFAAVQGGMALFGSESKDLEATLLKVQSAMALSQGIQALGESMDSFKQLKAVAINAMQGIKAAISSTGIGLLVVALGTVVAYWDDIKESVSGVSDEQTKLNVLTQKNVDEENKKLASLGSQDNILKLQGKSEKEILGLKINQTDEAIKAYEINIENIKTTNQAQEEAAARNYKYLKSFLDFITIPQRYLYESAAKNINSIIDLINKIPGVKITAKIDEAFGDKATDYLAKLGFDPDKTKKEGEAVVEEANKTLLKLKNDRAGYQLAINDINKKAELTDAQKREKQKERDKKYFEEIDQSQTDFDTTALEKLDAVNQAKRDRITKYNEDEIAARTQQELLIAQIQYDSEEEQAQRRKEARDKKLQEFEGTTQAVASIAKSGEDLLLAIQANGLAKSKAGQAAMKGLALVQIAADSAIAFSKMMQGSESSAAGAASVAGPAAPGVYTATKIAFYASGTATILANIARAKALLSGNGGASGGGSTTLPTTGGGAGATAPQFNVVGNTGVNQLAGVIGNREAAPVQAYVVANNVTTAQSLDRNIIASATLGG